MANTEHVTASGLKPAFSLWQIWNMSVGFFGLQIGFALQNANASRIFQTLGADVDKLALFWLAGPITGLVMQPIIGYMSDRTWGRFGRRRPYFFIGALLAAFALLFMPNSPAVWIAVASLWILDASLNISMEPFRAFVGDNLSSKQRTLGYAMQGFMIGGGGMLASYLPNILTSFGVSNVAEAGMIPDSVKYAFYVGAALLFFSVLWTIVTTKEYSPDDLRAYDAADTSTVAQMRKVVRPVPPASFFVRWGAVALTVGLALFGLIWKFETDKQFSVFAALVSVTGLLFLLNGAIITAGKTKNMISEVLGDLATMPLIMKRLAAVQFTSWFAFFIMWIYLTPAITAHHFGSTDPTTTAYGEGALSVNGIFAWYSGVAFIVSLGLPILARAIGLKPAYALTLLIGGAGVASLFVLAPPMFWLSSIAIGIAWAAVLTLPYAILADALPAERMGTYMGIFNFFIVIPQIVVGTIMGPVVKNLLGGQAILALVIGGGVMAFGALLLAFVPYKDPVKEKAA